MIDSDPGRLSMYMVHKSNMQDVGRARLYESVYNCSFDCVCACVCVCGG